MVGTWHNYPPVDELHEGASCYHDESTGKGHVLVDFYGGRRGYASATPSELSPELIERARKAGWRRCRVSTCGYGEPANPREIWVVHERLQELARGTGLIVDPPELPTEG